MMDPLAVMWIKHQIKLVEMDELRRLAIELHEKQDELRPAIRAALDRRIAAQRMDGPTGFVMVPRP